MDKRITDSQTLTKKELRQIYNMSSALFACRLKDIGFYKKFPKYRFRKTLFRKQIDFIAAEFDEG